MSHRMGLVLVAVGLIVCGCSSKTAQNTNTAVTPAVSPSVAPSATPQSSPDKTSTAGRISAVPNPIQVCDGSGLGATTIFYFADPPVKVVEVRVGSPSGAQLAHAVAGDNRSSTGKWVNDGAVFYLQDVSGGKSLTLENTLATVTVKLTSQGCK